ncbi:MAG: Gfo/Idh/MocA family oxidoreductase [Cyanobacteria bacterium J06641_5]
MALGVGLVGTGAAAKRRAAALQDEARGQLLAVTGSNRSRRERFADTFGIRAVASVAELVALPQVKLVIVATVNCAHGQSVRAALEAGKHVVVEYPLSLDPQEAWELLALAQARDVLLHVEHIELLGGVHAIARDYLPRLGPIFRASYRTIAPKHPAPRRWSYHHEQLGYPLCGALSRIHRVLDLLTPSLGPVVAVTGRSRFWDAEDEGYFRACWCEAELGFATATATVTYGKGETFWLPERVLEIFGEGGRLLLSDNRGAFIDAAGTTDLPVEPTRGSFAMDTAAVFDFLELGKPLYVRAEASCRALEIANTARLAATGTSV